MSHSQRIRPVAAFILLAGLAAAPAFSQTFAGNGTTTVSVSVGAEASIAINTSSTTLASSGTLFSNYTGTTNLTYKIRTSQSTGSGNIVLQITSDFDGTGGPKVAAPPSPGDALTYDCTAGSGTPCTAGQTAATTSTTPVAAFGADAHSTKTGDAGSVAWTLTNDPAYRTGSYNARATFTISAN